MFTKADKLFLQTLDDLEGKLASEEPYDVLRASGLLRQLLLDDSRLIDQVNRDRKLKIRFRITQSEPKITSGSRSQAYLAIDSLDADTAPPDKTRVSATRDRLLAEVVAVIGTHAHTVREIILFESDAMGGVHHLDSPRKPEQQALVDIADFYGVRSTDAVLEQLRAIGRVVLKGLKPLREQIMKEAGSAYSPPSHKPTGLKPSIIISDFTASTYGPHEAPVNLCKMGVDATPLNPEAHYDLGLAYLREGELGEAVSSLGEAVRLKPEYGEAHHELGRALGCLGRFEDALEEFRIVISYAPRFPPAHFLSGVANEMLGRKKAALRCFRKAARFAPAWFEAWNRLGVAWTNVGKYDKAVSAQTKAAEIDGKSPKAYFDRATAYYSGGHAELAIDSLQTVVKLKPDLPEPYYNLGIASVDLGKYDAALAAYDKATEVKPNYAEVWSNKCAVLLVLGSPKEAVRAGEEAVRLAPKLAAAHENLGEAFLAAGHKDLALRELEILKPLDECGAQRLLAKINS